MSESKSLLPDCRQGALAGALATLLFIVVHDIFISDIWSMAGLMLVTGAICGTCIAWSYGLLVKQSTVPGWLLHNLIYTGFLMLLGLASLLLFEPVTTMAALVSANGLPLDLLGRSMPLAAIFTLMMAVGITLGYGGSWQQFAVVLLASALLVLLLGHNVFILGLVEIPSESFHLVWKMFGLIVLLDVMFASIVVALKWRRLWRTVVAKPG